MIIITFRNGSTLEYPNRATLKEWCIYEGYEYFNDGRIYDVSTRNYIGRFIAS